MMLSDIFQDVAQSLFDKNGKPYINAFSAAFLKAFDRHRGKNVQAQRGAVGCGVA